MKYAALTWYIDFLVFLVFLGTEQNFLYNLQFTAIFNMIRDIYFVRLCFSGLWYEGCEIEVYLLLGPERVDADRSFCWPKSYTIATMFFYRSIPNLTGEYNVSKGFM